MGPISGFINIGVSRIFHGNQMDLTSADNVGDIE